MKIVNAIGVCVCCVGIQANASVVYEGFDYVSGTNIVGQGTGDGWDGDRALGGGSNPSVVSGGLVFSALSVSGGVGHSALPNQVTR